MKKRTFQFLYITFFFCLLLLFIYCGLSYEEITVDGATWKAGTFILNTQTKIIGCVLLISIPTFWIISKKKMSDI